MRRQAPPLAISWFSPAGDACGLYNNGAAHVWTSVADLLPRELREAPTNMLRASLLAALLLLGVSAAFGQLTLWNIQAHDNNRSPETVPGYYDDWLIFDRVNWDPVNAPWMENDLTLVQCNVSVRGT